MGAPVTLRTEVGDELLDLWEFESRVRQGEVSPQSLVRLPAVTGERFVPACDLELYKRLHEPKKAYFRRAFTVAHFPWMTSALIFINLAVYLSTVRNGRLELDEMVAYGGKVGPLVADLGEFWRLFTANFLHRDAVHIGLNLFVLFNVGGALENTYRRLDYVWLLVFTGIATMATSLVLNDAVTIGASGMVFGCMGGVVAFGLKYRALLPSHYRSIMGDAALPTVLGLLFIGLTSQGVDNWAHVGGLAAGLLTGAYMRPRLLAERGGTWEPALRALPSLTVLTLVFLGQPLFGDLLPRLHQVRDDTFGVAVPVPFSWVRGATPLGTEAWFNGLAGLGRATFSAEAVQMLEGADPRARALTFIEERLAPDKLGPDVHGVRHEAPEPVRLADRASIRVRATIDEVSQRTRLWAYFVPRGDIVYQLVFSWPLEYPRYAQVTEQMLAGVKLEEPEQLRQARAEALLFPNSPPTLARLGAALLEYGEPTPAADALQAAVRAEPSNSRYRVSLARAQLAAGEVEAACASARAAVAFDPFDAPSIEAEARCELARGNPRRALARLQDARLAAPADERLKKAEATLRGALKDVP